MLVKPFTLLVQQHLQVCLHEIIWSRYQVILSWFDDRYATTKSSTKTAGKGEGTTRMLVPRQMQSVLLVTWIMITTATEAKQTHRIRKEIIKDTELDARYTDLKDVVEKALPKPIPQNLMVDPVGDDVGLDIFSHRIYDATVLWNGTRGSMTQEIFDKHMQRMHEISQAEAKDEESESNKAKQQSSSDKKEGLSEEAEARINRFFDKTMQKVQHMTDKEKKVDTLTDEAIDSGDDTIAKKLFEEAYKIMPEVRTFIGGIHI